MDKAFEPLANQLINNARLGYTARLFQGLSPSSFKVFEAIQWFQANLQSSRQQSEGWKNHSCRSHVWLNWHFHPLGPTDLGSIWEAYQDRTTSRLNQTGDSIKNRHIHSKGEHTRSGLTRDWVRNAIGGRRGILHATTDASTTCKYISSARLWEGC